MKSSDFEWVTDGNESFEFLSALWDVGLAKELIRSHPRRIESISVPSLAGLLLLVDLEEKEVDVTVPLICIRVGRGKLPIDGWHRVKKATELGLLELPVVCLNRREERKVRMR